MEIDWRLAQLRAHHTGKNVPVNVTAAILDPAFSREMEYPVLRIASSLDAALQSYWQMLSSAAEALTFEEWKLLEKQHSSLVDGLAANTREGFAATYRDRFSNDQEWHADVEAVRKVIDGKLCGMTQTDYLAIIDILGMLQNARSDDAIFSMSAMIPALAEPPR